MEGSAEEVLARIVPGDPLHMRRRVAERVRAQALFLDLERACLRGLAHVAQASTEWRGRPPLGPFVDACIDEAIHDLLAEERHSVQDTGSAAIASVTDPLAGPLGLDHRVLRDACIRFHALPHRDRNAFFHVIVEPDGVLEVGETWERARHALHVLSTSDSPSSRRSHPPLSPRSTS